MPSFDLNYPQNPWASITQKERPWYFPTLYREFARKTVYNRFVGMEFNHNGPKATELYIDTVMQPHADHSPIDPRAAWLESSTLDSFRRKITFKTYAGKMTYHKYDDSISFWQRDNVGGLRAIITEAISSMMTSQMDKLARDAFLSVPFRLYGDGAGGFTGTGFGSVDADDILTVRLLEDIRLGLAERDVTGFQDDDGNGFNNTITCITSPGVISDLRNALTLAGNGNTFIDINRYANPAAIIKGEVGTFHGVRFVQTNNAILYNTGAITNQNTIALPVSAGDGSPAHATAVDGLEFVGQPGAVHHITLTAVTGLAVGNIVSIHINRTSANGVTNGVDYTDGKLQVRRIVAIDVPNKRVSLDRPVLTDFKVDLGTSVFGYVTKARHIHSAVFISGPNAVVSAVQQPPMVYNPSPVDDRNAIWRVSFDYSMGWVPFEKNSAEVVFLAGSNRVTGPRVL